jgi:TrkA domain protein
MTEGVRVERTPLPGIGVRDEFVTGSGRRIGVISRRSGRRELVVYDRNDPDACSEVVRLSDEEADALAEILGAPRVVERLAILSEQVSSLLTEQLPVLPGSPYAGRTLGETGARTRTGASVVAVLRSSELVPSPTPTFEFAAGDTLIVVGTREGIDAVADIMANG